MVEDSIVDGTVQESNLEDMFICRHVQMVWIDLFSKYDHFFSPLVDGDTSSCPFL